MEPLSSKAEANSIERKTQAHIRLLKPAEKDCGRVLVVEDEEELIEILEFNLVRQGFEVLLAKDGLEACRVIGREKPELILLDIMLPLLDGWEICRMVRSQQDSTLARTPIIMLSALGATENRLKGYGLGADLYLPKPYSVKEVILKAKQLIRQYREYRQLSRQVSSMQKWSNLQDQWQQALFHELRNQLTVISGMAQHMRQHDPLSAERSGQFVEQISNSSEYLGTLAENYLLVRQVESDPDQLQAETIDLQELLADLRQLFGPLAEQKSCSLEFVCSGQPSVQLHPVGLKIVLSSLLDNALKYSTLDGRIGLQVRQTESAVVIEVTDEGPGIAASERLQPGLPMSAPAKP